MTNPINDLSGVHFTTASTDTACAAEFGAIP